MADYPSSLPTFDEPGTNLDSPAHSGLHTQITDELAAALAELGLSPSDTFSTVKARFDYQGGRLEDQADRLDDLEDDAMSASVTSGVTAASGWSTTSITARVTSNTVWFYLVMERTGADVTVGGVGGDIGNITIATLPASLQGSLSFAQVLSSGAAGRGAFGQYGPNSGIVTLSAVTGTGDIATNDSISLGGCVRINP